MGRGLVAAKISSKNGTPLRYEPYYKRRRTGGTICS